VLHPGGIAPGRWLSALLAGGETRPDERPRGDETDHATETGAGTTIPDLDAFEAFFRQHQDAVYGYLLRMTGAEIYQCAVQSGNKRKRVGAFARRPQPSDRNSLPQAAGF
jgi:hypothetical protein